MDVHPTMNHQQNGCQLVSQQVSTTSRDITNIILDVVDNAAKENLTGGTGVDRVIHEAAGPRLLQACQKIVPCRPGKAKVMRGYNLPAKAIIHTVGPTNEQLVILRQCY